MVKRALTLFTSLLFALPLLMPFNIYADTLSQSEIVGVTFNKIDQDVTYVNSSGTYTYIYEIEVLLKNKYVGVVDGTLSYSYSEIPTSHTITSSKRTYVNGNSFKLNVSIVQFDSSYTGSSPMYSASFLVNAQNTNVTKYEDLTSIETAVSVLQDIYTNSNDIENLSTNQLAELEKIVQNTSLANEYLEDISKMKQWNIPIESFGFNHFLFVKNYEIFDYFKLNYYQFPIFILNKNADIMRVNIGNNDTYHCIMAVNTYWINNQTVHDGLGLDNNYEITNTVIQRRITNDGITDYGSYLYLISFDITNKSGSFQTIHLKASNISYNKLLLVPIYFDNYSKNISTDFALQFGLTNQLLDDLHIIANGTVQSNSAASSSDLANSQLQTDSNTLFTQEDNFKSDMNNAMQNVNNTFRLQDMGTKFVSSAQWVRTQYESLTNNTPFASLITFSLITGLALILLGKVYK